MKQFTISKSGSFHYDCEYEVINTDTLKPVSVPMSRDEAIEKAKELNASEPTFETCDEQVKLMTGKIEAESTANEFGVTSVIIRWMEAEKIENMVQDENGNWSEPDSVFTDIEDANKALRERALNAPNDGCYDKVDFIVYFNDGNSYSGRCDLQYQHHIDYTLQGQMVSFIQYYVSNPEHAEVFKFDMNDLKSTLELYKSL